MAQLPTCTCDSLIHGGETYRTPTISPAQQRALKLYAMVLELQALGGGDYRDTMGSTLITNALSLCCKFGDPDTRRAACVAIAFNNAGNAGATVPASINDKLEACRELSTLCEKDQEAIYIYLLCLLGYHETY